MTTQRSNAGALVGGALLIGFGVLAFIAQFFSDLHIWAYLWPLAVLACGSLFFIAMVAGGKSVAGLAIPGSIISVSGLMLLAQNLTGRWNTWSYGWTITLASVGLGIFIMGLYQGDEHNRRSGIKVMQIAAVMFVIFGAFFEMLFSHNNLFGSQYTFPVLLILLGGYLVFARTGLFERHASNETGSDTHQS